MSESESIEVNLGENRLFQPHSEFVKQAYINSEEEFQKLYSQSINSPTEFWGEIADSFSWDKKWNKVLNWETPPFAKWFEGGKLNITKNCLDRHLTTKKNKPAIIWEGEPGDSKSFSYQELHENVCRVANGLKKLGLQKGDRVAIYLPMIPELAFSVLACARLGLVHSVVFAGFSAPSLRDRINDCEAKLLITADGGYRRGNVLDLKSIVDEAIAETPCLQHCLVVKRANNKPNFEQGRDIYWNDFLQGCENDCEAESMDSQDPLFILYTSGSTGKPKGIQHSTGGYMVGTYASTKYVFDIKEDDIYWCTADVGWVTGHSYLIYGPLLNGASIVMYEGAPNFPAENRFWEVVEKYKVSIFYTAPTAIRAFMKWGDEHIDKHDLSSLRLLGTVGEPINPEAWMWYHKKIGNEKCPIVDTWWQTETGSIMITPIPGVTATRPGCATRPFFGVDVAIVDENGNELDNNQGGLLVIRKPWPSMLTNIYGDTNRFKEVYWSKFKKQGYYFAGDGAVKDDKGYITILGRVDDVINVSGHRLSTMELESVLVAHNDVAEAAVVGFEHAIKGEAIAAFITPNKSIDEEVAIDVFKKYIVKEIGPFARPDVVKFTEVLPKTRSGKIMRRLLKDIAAKKEITGDLSTIENRDALQKLIDS